MKAALDVAQAELFRDLGPRAVHQHDADAESDQQGQVLGQHRQGAGGHQFTGESHDESLAAECMNIRRDGTQPLDELGRVFHLPHYNSLRDVRTKS